MPQGVEEKENIQNGDAGGSGSPSRGGSRSASATATPEKERAKPELDDFGLPVKKKVPVLVLAYEHLRDGETRRIRSRQSSRGSDAAREIIQRSRSDSVKSGSLRVESRDRDGESEEERFEDARSTSGAGTPNLETQELKKPQINGEGDTAESSNVGKEEEDTKAESAHGTKLEEATPAVPNPPDKTEEPASAEVSHSVDTPETAASKHTELTSTKSKNETENKPDPEKSTPAAINGLSRGPSVKKQGISEWSHQQLASKEEEAQEEEEDEWQTMPAYAPYDIYDDDNKLIAREAKDSGDEGDAYSGLGGAGKGYTRLQLDEDAQSATSLDENTQYLFKDVNGGTGAGEMEDEEQRDAVSQMQATKDLLTEGQRIAYVGMTRLILSTMVHRAETMPTTKAAKKDLQGAAEATRMWSQKMMVRLYAHMEISAAEQIMIEQLADHGVMPSDLTPTLMQNARVKNPMAENPPAELASPRSGSVASFDKSPRPSISSPLPQTPISPYEEAAEVPPPYQEHEGDDLPEVRTPSQLPTTKNIDIDLRWTVLCDLFLTLIADSVYDARSRTLLEQVGENMEVSWLEICRFEKRVTDALEMQQAAEKENWNEDEHKESRRKMALKKRYMMMGLATVGGSLVIGLSAGLLAPVIGAGLAAGFTTIGVAGTSGFLAGAGGAAIITSGAAASGGIIAVRAANRRTGAVKTFEYRPLHNNKRVNLIVTVSGWMTGKVDDVRLPYSTVNPIMGDIYSVLWEPEMLTSMGDTINILATEALTQTVQQVLGSTVLIGLMAALQLPVVLTKLAYLIDNPWTVSLDRANAAGLILADSLIDRNLGTRPITFVGYSLGSRVIFSCLKELSKKGAYGLVQNVYLFGSPIVAKKDEYLRARTVVAGRFVNGYAKNDWILGYLFRLTSGGISRIAGLAPVEEVPGLENVDVTELVPGHMAYRTAMPRLLREVGWVVESDEFTEIEDPDPENHQKRQRELINEIEEARKEFEKKEKDKESKGKFGFFGRKKKMALERKEWETYEEYKGESESSSSKRTEDQNGNNHGVLFDIDAIRAELASEQMEVKELKSTLPPMKLDFKSPLPSPNPRSSLRETKSFEPPPGKSPGFLYSPSPSPHHHTTPVPTIRNAATLPTLSPLPPQYAQRHEPDEEIQMTFDTAYHSPSLSFYNGSPSIPPRLSSSTPQRPSAEALGLDGAAPQRPEMKSATTMPASLSAVDLGRNAWADEEDELEEGWGKEREEVELTFA